MRFDKKTALADIDAVLAYKGTGDDGTTEELITHAYSCILRYAPPNSPHRVQAERYRTMGFTHAFSPRKALHGVLRSLRTEVDGGCLQRFESIVSAEVFSDLLGQAEALIDDHYRRAAAVLAGATLEEHLRRLAAGSSISTQKPDGKPLQASNLNADLYKANVYSKAEHAQVDAWQKIRNAAAHGIPDFETNHTDADIARMASGIRDFILKHPA